MSPEQTPEEIGRACARRFNAVRERRWRELYQDKELPMAKGDERDIPGGPFCGTSPNPERAIAPLEQRPWSMRLQHLKETEAKLEEQLLAVRGAIALIGESHPDAIDAMIRSETVLFEEQA